MSKQLYEEMIGKYNSLEAHFKFLEEEYYEKTTNTNINNDNTIQKS